MSSLERSFCAKFLTDSESFSSLAMIIFKPGTRGFLLKSSWTCATPLNKASAVPLAS